MAYSAEGGAFDGGGDGQVYPQDQRRTAQKIPLCGRIQCALRQPELEVLMREHICEFEKVHGKIEFEEDKEYFIKFEKFS